MGIEMNKTMDYLNKIMDDLDKTMDDMRGFTRLEIYRMISEDWEEHKKRNTILEEQDMSYITTRRVERTISHIAPRMSAIKGCEQKYTGNKKNKFEKLNGWWNTHTIYETNINEFNEFNKFNSEEFNLIFNLLKALQNNPLIWKITP